MNIDLNYAVILMVAAFFFGRILTKETLKIDGYFKIKKEDGIVSICRMDILNDIDQIATQKYLILEIKEDDRLESISQKEQAL